MEAAKQTPARRSRSKKDVASAEETPAKKGRKKSEEDVEKAAAPRKRSKSPKREKSPIVRAATPRRPAPEGSRTLRVISVNVAGLRAVLNNEEKSKELQALVEQEVPDVLCLNETKLKEDDVGDAEEGLRKLLLKEYDVMHWTCSTARKGYSGVAVILKQGLAIPDPSSIGVAPGMGAKNEEDEIIMKEGRILTVNLPDVTVVATYVPNSGTNLDRLDYRVNRSAERCWDRALAEYVSEQRSARSKPVLLIGDMNCCWGVRDFWNTYERPDFPEKLEEKAVDEQYVGLKPCTKQAGLTPEERKSFPMMLKQGDMLDTFRQQHPEAQGVFSYFSQRVVQNRPLNRGLRLDYALATSELCEEGKVPRVQDSYILDERPLIADHAPIGCDVLLPA